MALSSSKSLTSFYMMIAMCLLIPTHATNFYNNFDITWGGNRAKVLNSGEILTLSLDQASGSGFQTKNLYMFGRITMQLKLVPGNSAGTVTSYYLKSEGNTWDEIDFEFLGNVTGQPYVVHTNVYTQGKGNREQQFYLWFDPTKDFHTYAVLWNPQTVVFYVDNIPIREFMNMESKGVPFPKDKPMRLFSSIYNADQWATRGGLIKTDWSMSPFTASYRNFDDSNACVWPSSTKISTSCTRWLRVGLQPKERKTMRAMQRRYRIYDYCIDGKRFPGGMPRECRAR